MAQQTKDTLVVVGFAAAILWLAFHSKRAVSNYQSNSMNPQPNIGGTLGGEVYIR